jgi:ketosteroid isomerase-like protein
MIRKIILSLVTLTFCFGISFGQSKIKAEHEVREKVEQLRQAMITPDSATLDKLVAENLSYGHSGGKVEDKQSFMSTLLSGQSDFVTIDIKDLSISVSNDVAIVRHQLIAQTNDKDKGPGNVRLGVMLVWQKQKKNWVLIARQAVKL